MKCCKECKHDAWECKEFESSYMYTISVKKCCCYCKHHSPGCMAFEPVFGKPEHIHEWYVEMDTTAWEWKCRICSATMPYLTNTVTWPATDTVTSWPGSVQYTYTCDDGKHIRKRINADGTPEHTHQPQS